MSNNLGTIWSNSWSATEQSFQTAASIQNLDKLYAQAAGQGITAFFATDDSGVANVDKQGNVYPFATVTYPSSSPNVVPVGGTQVTAPTASISSYQPESVWNDGTARAGDSTVFADPNPVRPAIPTRPGCGLPDVSSDAAVISAVLIYESFNPTTAPGWTLIAGTSRGDAAVGRYRCGDEPGRWIARVPLPPCTRSTRPDPLQRGLPRHHRRQHLIRRDHRILGRNRLGRCPQAWGHLTPRAWRMHYPHHPGSLDPERQHRLGPRGLAVTIQVTWTFDPAWARTADHGRGARPAIARRHRLYRVARHIRTIWAGIHRSSRFVRSP